jgi:hypothetical protein
MLEFGIFVFVACLVSLVSIAFVRIKNKNLELVMLLKKTIDDVEMLRDGFNGDALVEKEHLIAFLTQTREDAFKYIEDLHKALIEYKHEIEFDLNYPNDLSILRFRSAFEKLEKMFPEDIPND